MFEFDVAPGSKVPGPHSHDGYEETVYGLEGILTFTFEGKVTEVGPGRVLVIPRGAVHRVDNFHPTTATLLTVITPGILGPSYFREVADLLRASAGGPPDLASLGQIMHRHGHLVTLVFGGTLDLIDHEVSHRAFLSGELQA